MRSQGRRRPKDLISATEVAAYVYCPEQWRLEFGLGLPASNRAAREAGRRHHGRKAGVERLAQLLIALGGLLIALGVLGLLVLSWR
ncbi:hypothetical protein [Singulisphaera sp. PoT]|uniref:hypothetical protein n=1 Tax=Singulisphaera sp. PoT TaxID=3411797 RepID=UPI003BF4BA81